MMTLKPKKHQQIELFLADEVEISTIRDEIASMEHPFFALKAGDTSVREYKNGKTTVTIKPTVDGIATIFDKDIWIYAISKLQQVMNNGEKVDRKIYFTPYDFLVTTNRSTSGQAYKDLEKALSRLSGTRIKTNIKYSEDKQETIEFGLIDSWRILEEKKGKLDIGMVEVVLPNWLFEALEKKQILKISIDYFRIRKAIDRRIYEIARKHCGNQYDCEISLQKLHLKTGSTASKAEFKRSIKKLSKENNLPDYEVIFNNEREVITFKNRNPNIDEAEKMENFKRGKYRISRIKNIINKS
ncbi:RepB family plasmid replication initiator protein [Gilliamella sp. Occ3-1]|uniref:replication initiator protein A n=1 Tax=Gilliamella sp. Occ3-1 TaxID=3120253 RepID=UPI00080E5752|nr:replication initiator protein A [Gilliamella apicola]OCG69512.1 RepB family plasmid replication initiator protein [Gilliamella apicola]